MAKDRAANDALDLNAPVCCLACRQETTVGAQYATHLEFWCGEGAPVPVGGNIRKSAFIRPTEIVVIARCLTADVVKDLPPLPVMKRPLRYHVPL